MTVPEKKLGEKLKRGSEVARGVFCETLVEFTVPMRDGLTLGEVADVMLRRLRERNQAVIDLADRTEEVSHD